MNLCAKHRDTDTENGHVYRGGEGEGRMNWEDNTDIYTVAAAKSLQLCPTLSDPMDGSLPGSSIYGIFQAGVLEWVAIAFSTVTMRLNYE